MAWTCPSCGTKNDEGLFNFCKKCGSTPPRDSSELQARAAANTGTSTARSAPPAARTAEPRRPPPRVVTSAQRSGSSPGRRKRGVGRLVTLVVLAAGGVALAANAVDVGEVLHDLTAADPPTIEISIPDVTVPDVADLGSVASSIAEDAATAAEATAPPATTGPAVQPALAVARAVDVRCANRWNGPKNARARQQAVQRAGAGRLFAGVQLASGTSSVGGVGPPLDGVCVVIVGTQPDRSSPALRPGDVFAEAGPASGPRVPFLRLPTVGLSYEWNARMTRDGRIAPRRRG